MQKNISLSQSDIDRIIEMAWEDRTPFEAIEYQYNLKENEVRKKSLKIADKEPN